MWQEPRLIQKFQEIVKIWMHWLHCLTSDFLWSNPHVCWSICISSGSLRLFVDQFPLSDTVAMMVSHILFCFLSHSLSNQFTQFLARFLLHTRRLNQHYSWWNPHFLLVAKHKLLLNDIKSICHRWLSPAVQGMWGLGMQHGGWHGWSQSVK